MKRDWDIVTSYIDNVGTSDKTVLFPKPQDSVKVTNKGNTNLIYTIGTKSGTLAPNGSVTVNEVLTNFSLRAETDRAEYEVKASEAGTDQEESTPTLPSDVAGTIEELQSSVAEIATEKGIAKVLNKFNNKEPVTIVCKGDSMTYGFVGGTQTVNNYPKVLQDKLRMIYGYNEIYVINSGVPGATATNGLSDFQPSVIVHNPDLVIIMYGLNDTQSQSFDTFSDNLNEMCKLCLNNDIEVVLCTPTQAFMGAKRNDIINFSEKVRQIAILNTTSFVNMFEEFRLLNESNYIPLNILGDDTHLRAEDYYILADIILANVLVPFTITNVKNELIVPATSNNVFTVGTNKYKDSKMLTGCLLNLKNTNVNDTIKIAVYVRKNNDYSIVLIHPSSDSYATATVLKEGVSLKTINGTKTANIYDDRTFLSNLSLGLNFFEIKANQVTGGSGGNVGQFAVEGFVLNKNNDNPILLDNAASTNNHSVEVLGKVFDNISCKSPSLIGAGTAKYSYLTKNVLNLINGKTMVLEFNFASDGYGGFGWFGYKRYLNSAYYMGYWVRIHSTGISVWNLTTKLGEHLTTLTPNNFYKIRVEHNSNGEIKIFLDNTLVITVTNTTLQSGCLFFSLGESSTYATVKDLYQGFI
jgi:lysophospholipase L1-like esterase